MVIPRNALTMESDLTSAQPKSALPFLPYVAAGYHLGEMVTVSVYNLDMLPAKSRASIDQAPDRSLPTWQPGLQHDGGPRITGVRESNPDMKTATGLLHWSPQTERSSIPAAAPISDGTIVAKSNVHQGWTSQNARGQ